MVGICIKLFLDEHEIAYTDMAQALGIQKEKFEAMLNRECKISAEEYLLICKMLNVRLEYFSENKIA